MDKERLLRCFAGQDDYIPLIVKAPEELSPITAWEAMQDPQKALDMFEQNTRNIRQIHSDYVPMGESNFLEVLLPSLFGAKPFEGPGGSLDVKPIYEDIEDPDDLLDLEVPDIEGGMMDYAIHHLRYMLEHKPDWMHVELSRPYSPIDCAVVLRGGDFYLDLVTNPEAASHLMDVITETTIRMMRRLKEVAGYKMKEQLTIRGLYYPGIRLTSDAVVNLSPAMIQEFYFPQLKKFKEAFGNVMLHYCCRPAPSGHVLPTLVKCDYVNAVDNWQGHETFFNKAEDMLQDKIFVCTDLPYEDVVNYDEYAAKHPFFSQVKRKGGRGLCITTVAPDVESGNRLYQQWQERFK